MFDIGFSEMVLIGIVALLVLGPERLPKVARAAGLWAGRARRFLATVKADIDHEIKTEELKQIMRKEAESTGVREVVVQTQMVVGEIRDAAAESVVPSAREPAFPDASDASTNAPSAIAAAHSATQSSNDK